LRQRIVGGVEVGAIALGGVGWSLPKPLDERLVTETIHAAIDAGFTLIDTALAYTTRERSAHNERAIATALRGHPRSSSVLVATKGGHFRSGDKFPVDGRPETIRRQCESSLRALEVESIGLYQLHHPDPHVPIEETMGAFAELRDEGKILLAGVSNVTVGELERARSVVEIASVQNRFSPGARDRSVLDFCSTRGIAFLAYSPLGGAEAAASLATDFPAFGRIAAARGVSPQQVALAWELAQSPALIPIVGARRPETAVASSAAAALELDAGELRALE
jgi:aryl-alcohol dehydrogenase-like predicted oxidoreductase